MKTTWVGVVVCVVTATAGCSHRTSSGGSAQIAVHALSLANVAAVDVSVSGQGIPTPMESPLFLQADGTWQATLGHIPVGTGRTFAAKAYDATNKTHRIYSGSVTNVTISSASVANVIIVLQEDTPNPDFANHAPLVDGMSVSATSVSYGDKVAVRLTAHDPDQGETAGLVFTSGQSCGAFEMPVITTNDSGQRVWANLWTAPPADGACRLTFEIVDAHGAMAMAAVTIQVSAGPDTGGARVSTLVESYPIITNVTSTPVAPAAFLAAGGSTTLMVLATQPDQEPMTFAWSSDCLGVFDNASTQSPRFTLAAGSTASTCSFTVVVSGPSREGSDGQWQKLSTTGSLTVNVGATSAAAVGGPVIDLTSQSAVAVAGGGVVTLYLRARETNGSAVLSAYSWSAPDGVLASPVHAPDFSFSQADWTPPSVMASPVRVTVTVTDSQGATAIFAFVFCTCHGTGPGGVPVTASCDEEACGSDYTVYLCTALGWSGTGQSCGSSPDSGVCECHGTGPGGVPVTVSCGQSACGSDYFTYSCSAAGWSSTGQSCACECNGTGPGGVPVTASCGQSACGSDYMTYSCSASGWSGTGQSCGSSPDSGVCECHGTGPGGVPVTAACGQSACGSDYMTYSCSATGWSATGTPCP